MVEDSKIPMNAVNYFYQQKWLSVCAMSNMYINCVVDTGSMGSHWYSGIWARQNIPAPAITVQSELREGKGEL